MLHKIHLYNRFYVIAVNNNIIRSLLNNAITRKFKNNNTCSTTELRTIYPLSRKIYWVW
jgi:hypothetical protein